MTIKERLLLLAGGFKAAEIREMEKAENEMVKDSDQEEEKTEEVEEVPEPEEEKVPEVDYKALYEESQKALQKAQENNRKMNINEVDEDESNKLLKDIVSSFI